MHSSLPGIRNRMVDRYRNTLDRYAVVGGDVEASVDSGAGLGALIAFLPFVRPYRWVMAGALFALVVTAVLSLSLPVLLRVVIDNWLLDPEAASDLPFLVAVGIAGLLAIGSATRFYLVSRLGEHVVTDVRMAVYNRMIGMSPAYFETIMTGEVLSRITTDTTLVQTVVGSSASIALRNLLILFGGMVVMALTSARLSGLALIIVPMVIVPILLLGRRVRRFSKMTQDRVADCSADASETLSAVQIVQAFTLEDESRQRFAERAEQAFGAALHRVESRALMTVFVIFLIAVGVVGVLWVGTNQVRSEMMTPGELVQFLVVAVMVAGSAAALTEVWGEIQRAVGAAERLGELLRAEDTVRDPPDPVAMRDPIDGRITFAAVSFLYPSRPGFAALHDVSFDIRAGETVAIVGPSGAGKSTVFQLLLRFFDPAAGEVRLDGVDIRRLNREVVRRQMAYVSQEPVVFAASAIDNIRFGRIDADDEQVFAAARAAAVHDFLISLPDGYRTHVGERGIKLSGGQRQRIAMARAILRDAPILLLDEATSALDSENERLVQQAVDRLSAGRTTLIVAHRLSTVKKADRIIVLDKGRVEATGTHAALIEAGGLYARLANLQLSRD